ncbi:MAG: dihydrolipoyl dehydrogenase [Chitinophagales bacterium]
MSEEQRWDLVVVGAGPAGYVGAVRAAQLGARVAVIDESHVGGTCLNRGCIPTKALAATAEVLSTVRRAGEFGIEVGEVRIDFSKAMARQRQVVERLRRGILFLFKKHGVTLFTGKARFLDPHRLAVVEATGSESVLVADRVLVATGSRPAVPPLFGWDGEQVITSDEALALPALPQSLLILGGGVIGCEFASFFATLGTKVTVLELMPSILPLLDREVAGVIHSALKKKGVVIQTGVKAVAVDKGPAGVSLTLEGGAVLEAERLLVSIGRRANTEGLGLEAAGVVLTGRGEIAVDARLRTNQPHIAAAGDVTAGRFKLAHVASHEALAAVESLLGREAHLDYLAVPGVVFTSPEAAGVGLTEEEARAEAEQRGEQLRVGKFSFVASGKALAGGEYEGFVKVLAGGGGRLYGVHIVGPHASDLLPEAVLALQSGLGLDALIHAIHAHPTLSEAVWEAATAAREG